MDPCTRIERYQHLPSGREIQVNRRRGFGPSGMRKHINQMGVFFYRGDSGGEGGSGTLWLTVRRKATNLMAEVLQRMLDGGLIVTDGSNCCSRRNSYKDLGRFYQTAVDAEAMSRVGAFADDTGNRFRCIGYLGQRYGPTLAWQVEKALLPLAGAVCP